MCCSTARWRPCRRTAPSWASTSTRRSRARRCTSTPSTFPIWGMLEKLAPTLLAGVPAIVKPASSTAYLTEAAFKVMIEAGVLPPGSVQLIVGGVGDLFDHLTGQDVVSFTGSASTALKLRSHPVVLRESVKFVAEQDSLNASLLGPDAAPGTPEFDLFVKEVVDRNDGQGGPEMHRDPPRHGPGRASRRGRSRDPRAAPGHEGRRPPRQGQPDGRARLERPARRRPQPDRQAGRRRRAHRLRRSRRLAGRRRRRLPRADPAAQRRSVEHARRPRLSRRSARSRP